MAFVVFSVIASNAFIVNAYDNMSERNSETQSLGGPTPEITMESQSGSVLGVSMSSNSEEGVLERSVEKTFIFMDEATAVSNSHPFSSVIKSRDGLKIYKVQEDDTLSEVAAQFGVSLDTIKLANPEIGSSISPGQKLTILPVSGILYEVEEDDTVHSVAAEYHTDPELIKEYNSDYQKAFDTPGQTVILPHAEPKNKWTYMQNQREDLPDLNGFFESPADGWNWEKLHYKNGVDIANECGTPIYASAEGLVVEEVSNDYWNKGYGNYIVIEHPNPEGTESIETKYAHTLKNFVAQGDYVLQGEQIALIGNTGNTHGPTGCHLHFEIHGAQNPFVSG